MVIAGIPHPDYEEFERHLKHVSTLRFGDLVILQDGQHALIVDPLVTDRPANISVFQGNGLNAIVDWSQIHTVCLLPNSEAHVNFQEVVSLAATPLCYNGTVRCVPNHAPPEELHDVFDS